MAAEMDHQHIQEAVREKYRKVARSAEGLFKYATGPEGARLLGYEAQLIADAPSEMMNSFCGVGNPFSLGNVGTGATVLDVGCGAGFDVYVASRAVGEKGRALGVDLTLEMVAVARQNLDRADSTNADVQHGTSEELPYESNAVDVLISNGVFNLSPNKHRSFEEVLGADVRKSFIFKPLQHWTEVGALW